MARFVDANGLTFAYESRGDDGPLALLLHGFPDTAATWRHLAPRLADAGFRVVMPWMRGYAPTQVPADGQYSRATLARDANALHAALGGDDQAVLVGHDWGAVAAYEAATVAPERWRRVVTLAVPPTGALLERRLLARQLRRSWYMFAAQFPVERLGHDRVMARVMRLWQDWSPGYAMTAEDRDGLLASLRAPEALSAALGYYRAQRAGLRNPRAQFAAAPVPPRPTLYLHGRDDGCMGAGYADRSRTLLKAADPASRVDVLDGVGHFLHLEDPDRVGAMIEAWVTS